MLVKRKILDIHFTRRVVDCRRFPFNPSRMIEGRFCTKRYFKISISTWTNNKFRTWYYRMQIGVILLIVQNNIWTPNVVWRNMEHIHATILIWIPSHLVIVPKLLNPKICSHNLISKILKWINEKEKYGQKREFFSLTTSISCDSFNFRRTITASVTFTTGLTSLL